MTREEASEAMVFVSESRIEKYESGKSPVRPEEVPAMAKAYKKPALCNYYCSHECPNGKEFVPEVRVKDLAQIVLQTLATMNSLEKAKDRFIETPLTSRSRKMSWMILLRLRMASRK